MLDQLQRAAGTLETLSKLGTRAPYIEQPECSVLSRDDLLSLICLQILMHSPML